MDEILKRFFESPAEALDNGIRSYKHLTHNKRMRKVREFWYALGPGFITGAADDDPSGIATYSQTGAQYGFQLLWLAGFTFPMMAIVQSMCARMGLVTGRGLAANIRRHYPKWVLYTCAALLFFANTLNIGANLGAMVSATQLIFPQLHFGILILGFTFFSLILQIFIPYGKYARFLKILVVALFSYILAGFSIHMNWLEVLKSALTPSLVFSKEQIFLVCAILGTTISPYLFFWQTSQETEEQILDGKKTIAEREGATHEEINKMRVDVWIGMFISNLVMFFVIATCAATLFASGITTIHTAADAAAALRPLAGENAYLLFTVGIIGTGLLAVPILAGASSYAISESFRWKFGLYRKLKEASAFYGVIIVSMLAGLAMNFIGIDPIKALIYSAVFNGLVAPVVLVLILQITSDEKIMGEWKNSPLAIVIGWSITTFMIIASIATITSLLI